MSASEAVRVTLRASGRVARRQQLSRSSRYILLGISLIGVVVLAFLAYDIVRTGGSQLNWDFITSYASRTAANAGIRAALIGSLWIMGLTLVIAIPIAVGAAIWIEEFAPRNKFTAVVKLNISNLAGVPSIIYGILGLTLFNRVFDLGATIITGALTLVLMILPMTIIASQEAIRQVPSSMRDASLALGATRWQTIWNHVLPGALPGIMTGLILAVSRAAGEAAALIMIGAAAFLAFDNTWVDQQFTVLPVQIYGWTTRPANQGFQEIAATGIIVLLAGVLTLNLIAAIIRERFRRT
jgi:phosphate transport system permease protein